MGRLVVDEVESKCEYEGQSLEEGGSGLRHILPYPPPPPPPPPQPTTPRAIWRSALTVAAAHDHARAREVVVAHARAGELARGAARGPVGRARGAGRGG